MQLVMRLAIPQVFTLRQSKLTIVKGPTKLMTRMNESEKSCQAVIPSRKNRLHPADYDRILYKRRHLIEHFFAKQSF